MIKTITLQFLALLLFVTNSYAQEVEKITAKDGSHYITTTINYPITGTYLSEGGTEPIIQLNPDGTGIFQLDDLSKITIA